MLGFLFGFLIGGRNNREYQRRTMVATERLADKLAPVPPPSPGSMLLGLIVLGIVSYPFWPIIHMLMIGTPIFVHH
jgi:hypothetical protein